MMLTRTYPARILCGLIACAIALSAAGCTSMQTIRPTTSPPAAPFGRIQPGDTVRVETRDGERAQFRVQQIDGDVLVSETGARYSRSDIVQLRRRAFSPIRTALLIGGVLLAYLVGEQGSPL